MREIKFRAWDKAEKKMITHPSLWTMDLEGGLFYGNTKMTKNDDVLNYPIILMQYTGLKDKNGKEIWEGDIAYLTDVTPNPKKTLVTIKFEKDLVGFGVFMFRAPSDMSWLQYRKVDVSTGSIDIEHTYSTFVEVIGNIYENSDLLK